jgi:hypothetical protein
MKLGMYIMAHEPISRAYFINPSHHSVCLSLLDSNSLRKLAGQRIHMHQQMNYWTRRFLCGPYRIKGKWANSSSQKFLLRFYAIISTLNNFTQNNASLRTQSSSLKSSLCKTSLRLSECVFAWRAAMQVLPAGIACLSPAWHEIVCTVFMLITYLIWIFYHEPASK